MHTEQATSVGRGVAAYLDDVYNRDAVQIRIQIRAGSLGVLENIGRHHRPQWNERRRCCRMCGTRCKETIPHFLVECPFYDTYRTQFMDCLALSMDRDTDKRTQEYGREVMMYIEGLAQSQWTRFLLDGVAGLQLPPHIQTSVTVHKKICQKVDKTINNYVWLCWEARRKGIQTQDNDTQAQATTCARQ